MKARIFDIKRFAVHDGDGIRTTVFFKGCPLRCLWCHNPEGLSAKTELSFYAHKCKGCGACAEVCAVHSLEDGMHRVDFNACKACGRCTEVCASEALQIFGKDMSVDDVFKIISEDKAFYEATGGGVTLSGGECLLYPDFCMELLKMCKENGINTAVDTSGFISKDAIDKVLPFTDVFLYDLKAYDEDVHIRCTGVSNKRILENLFHIDKAGKKIEIRIPYVPTFNDEEIPKLLDLVGTLSVLSKVRVLPYHSHAGSKYEALGMKNRMPGVRIPNEKECLEIEKMFEQRLKNRQKDN